MEDPRWDHYVYFLDPKSGVEMMERAYGLRTAEVLVEAKKAQGFQEVRIIHKRSQRYKLRNPSVYHRRLY